MFGLALCITTVERIRIPSQRAQSMYLLTLDVTISE
jgi:hypothetical protein